ncbi:MAG: HxlR-like helix-turn-helix [Methanoregula sp. PtaU1.Bin051]|nr:MAG: HxlR-like helix-turn-helix [Methanoregula sp. PtaU1.Bin051]
MARESNEACICPLEGVIDTISKKWALLIIHVLGNRPRLRFNELSKELEGISPKTLTDTLVVLQKEGFVGREAFSEIPPRVEYFLTNDGRELWDAILPLLQWTLKRENISHEECKGNCRKKPRHHRKS